MRLLPEKLFQKELDAKEINLFLPYMFYARQDKQVLAGESKSLKNIAELYESLNISNIFTVNSHLYSLNRFQEVSLLFSMLHDLLLFPNIQKKH